MHAWLACVIALAAGFASMCVELTAVRVLAPHFGDSAYVWTNVIGVILAALAAGAYCGGRLADGDRGGRALPWLFLGAAVPLALVPLLAAAVGDFLLPQDLPLDAAMPAIVRGSLAAVAILFGVPVFLMGAASPILIALVAQRGGAVGRAVGAISAHATLGSLLGTFSATHWLVPGIGCRATLWVCATLLAACAVVARRRPAPIAVAMLVLASLALHSGPLRAAGPGRELLAECESRYQYLQVQRLAVDGGSARTQLVINEGLDSFHSVAVAGSAFTGGCYYDYHMLAPLLAGDGLRPAGLRVLSIGDAAGSFRRLYAAVHPDAVVDAVELDPATVELGERFFPGRKSAGEVHADTDGRLLVQHAATRWQVVHVDAYAHQVYIPAHLASVEFFAAVKSRLLDGGVLALNVGGLRLQDPVVQAIGGTVAAVFGEAWAFRVPSSRNFLLVARAGGKWTTRRFEPPGGERLQGEDMAHWRTVLEVASGAAAWHRIGPAADPLHDDRPRLDRLLQDSYLVHEDEGSPLPLRGTRAASEVEPEVLAAAKAGDNEAVLAAIQSCRDDTAWLRLQCGDARWRLRQLLGAQAEYQLARSRQPGDLDGLLASRLQALAADLAPQLGAERIAARNGWLATSALAALLAAALGVHRMSRMPCSRSVRVSTAAR